MIKYKNINIYLKHSLIFKNWEYKWEVERYKINVYIKVRVSGKIIDMKYIKLFKDREIQNLWGYLELGKGVLKR